MAVKIKIPVALQRLTEGKPEVELDIGIDKVTLIDLISSLDKKYNGIAERVSADGKIRKFVNFYVNGEDIRFLENEQTPINNDYEISIIPALSGGLKQEVCYGSLYELDGGAYKNLVENCHVYPSNYISLWAKKMREYDSDGSKADKIAKKYRKKT